MGYKTYRLGIREEKNLSFHEREHCTSGFSSLADMVERGPNTSCIQLRPDAPPCTPEMIPICNLSFPGSPRPQNGTRDAAVLLALPQRGQPRGAPRQEVRPPNAQGAHQGSRRSSQVSRSEAQNNISVFVRVLRGCLQLVSYNQSC